MRVKVNFSPDISDWSSFQAGLNRCLPEDAIVDFRFSNSLAHPYFCKFIRGLDRDWTIKTTLVGPGLRCLMVYSPELTKRCLKIEAQFRRAAVQVGLIQWLGQAMQLTNRGYDVAAESPRPIKRAWLSKWDHGGNLQINVVEPGPPADHTRGFHRETRCCDGSDAIIWENGKYHPCTWAVRGGLKGNPVYAYGDLGEKFEKKGKENCHLRYCPLSEE